MWFVIKIFITSVAFAMRFLVKPFHLASFADKQITIEKIACYIYKTDKKKFFGYKTVATQFAIAFSCRSKFAFTRESFLDRLFKRLGVANELQAGDSSFDCQFYIASDSQAFREKIRIDHALREIIRELFCRGCTRIMCDGTSLWFHFPKDQTNNNELASLCVKFHQQVVHFNEPLHDVVRDRFSSRAAIVEGITLAIVVYAICSLFEEVTNYQNIYIDSYPLIISGLWLAGGIAFAWVLGMVFYMRGSSAGHHILIGSCLALGVFLPIAGMGIVHDVNIKFDNSQSIIIDTRVLNVYSKEHWRRGRTKYSYHVIIEPLQPHPLENFPTHIGITHELYAQIKPRDIVRIDIGQGYLRYPWYRAITLKKSEVSSI